MSKPNVNQRDVVILQRDPSNSVYEEIHISGSDVLFYIDSAGNLTADKINTFFVNNNAVGSASWASASISSSVADTASYAFSASYLLGAGGGLNVGELYHITASWAESASFASTASALFTASYHHITSSWAQTSSYALTSSLAYSLISASTHQVTASWAQTSSYALTASALFTASSHQITASNATSASYSLTASYAMNGGGGGTLTPGNTYDITSSWSGTSSFNGNRIIKRNDPDFTGINVGGNSVQEFLNNFFFPFVPATVAISSGGTTYYETGSYQTIAVASTITANDETSYGTGSVRRGGVFWTSSAAIPPLSFTRNDNNISASVTYQTQVQTNNNGSPAIISSNTKTATFVYPYLWGTSAVAGLSGNTLYTTFARQIQVQANKTVNMSGTAVFIYFCFPATYTSLNSILDPSSFESLANFQFSSSVIVTSSGLSSNWSVPYKVYRTIVVSNPNGNYQFKYI